MRTHTLIEVRQLHPGGWEWRDARRERSAWNGIFETIAEAFEAGCRELADRIEPPYGSKALYRDYEIVYDYEVAYGPEHAWLYSHKNYDGAGIDYTDGRCGRTASLETARAEIDERIDEEVESRRELIEPR